MKTMLVFTIGVVIGGLLLVGLLLPISTLAGSGESSPTELVSNVGDIYREALVAPFQEVEQEIQDEKIARFYHRLLQRTGLDKL